MASELFLGFTSNIRVAHYQNGIVELIVSVNDPSEIPFWEAMLAVHRFDNYRLTFDRLYQAPVAEIERLRRNGL